MATERTHHQAAQYLLQRRKARASFELLEHAGTSNRLEEAYGIQRAFRELLHDLGGAEQGYKVGLGDQKVQERLGICEPVVGVLFENWIYADGVRIDPGNYSHLGLECEIALVIKHDISPSLGNMLNWSDIETVHAAFELIDDRGATLNEADAVSIVADNGWNAGAVLGDGMKPERFLNNLAGSCALELDGLIYGESQFPNARTLLEVMEWLSEFLGRDGRLLRRGDIVLTGCIIGPHHPIPSSTYRFACGALPSVTVAIGD